jgi:hypothetical protein
MQILTLDNIAFDLNNLPDEVDENMRFSVLDNSDWQNPDFFFQPLIFLESFNSPAMVLSIGGYEVVMPIDWSIAVGDSQSSSDIEILPLTSLNDRGFEALCFNPLSGFRVEFKKIEIRNGYHERFWVKNVCAIGLSNGFIEPLESTGLMMIHQFVRDLVSTIQNRECITRFDIDSFNKNNVETLKGISKFVTMHYQFSQRDDTPYWKKLTMEKEYSNDYFDLSNNTKKQL